MAAGPLLHLVTLLAAKSGAGNTLIGVGRLLNNHLLVRALSAAAADANEPEEAGGNGEGDANPEGRQHLGTHVDVDVVGLESGFEYTGKCTVSGRGGCGSGNGEDSLSLDEIRVNKGVPGSSAGGKSKGKRKKRTEEMMVVTKLPHLEKIAKKPTMNSMGVRMMTMTKAQFIQPATFLYTFIPSSYLSPRAACRLVPFMPQTLRGSK